jgi:acyl dehydratase
MSKLWLEDLVVGRRFQAGPIVFEAEMMKAFARDNDPQYFHVDEEAASSSIFGGLIASGWQTAALTMRAVLGDGAVFGDGVVGAGGELRWLRPVRPGDCLSVAGEILEITTSPARPDRGMVKVLLTTSNQHGQPVQTLGADLVVFSRRRATRAD